MKEKYFLSKAETQVMNILWSQPVEGVTSSKVLEQYPEPRPAKTTVLTFLKRLTVKGFVKAEKTGKMLHFTPLISREEYAKEYLTDTKDTFFGGSPTSLVSFFVRHEQLTDEQVDELIDIIRKKRQLPM